MDSSEPVTQEEFERLSILGVRLDLANWDRIKDAVGAFLADPWDGKCRQIVTLNPEYVMAAQRSKEFRREIEEADLVIADGVGVVLAANLLRSRGSSTVERMTGVDLVKCLADSGAPLFLLGAGPGVAEQAARKLVEKFPQACAAGSWSGGTTNRAYDNVTLEKIGASGALALAVAYGAPGQVHWIARNQEELAKRGVRVAVGVGGAFDYIAGIASQPPEFVQRIGLEWMYRLIREPWRWRRQLVLPVFAVRVFGQWLWARGNRSGTVARPK